MKILRAENLTLKQGKQIICENLQWEMRTGECWGLLGMNGAGKTTLLHALCGLHKPTAGEILLDQKPLFNWRKKELARTISCLLQENSFSLSQTVQEYCERARFPHLPYFAKCSHEEIHFVQTQLALVDLLTLATRYTNQLSGGEKRRLAIASLLVQAPHFFLLDEPTNHLDIYQQAKILRHFQKLTYHQHGILLATHDIQLIQTYCTHVLMLLPDKTFLQGKVDEQLTSHHLSLLYQRPMQMIATQRFEFLKN